MNTGERIKAIRKEKGFTQKHLAELTGLSVNAIQSYEYGKYEPKIPQIEKIAEALDVSPFDIMYDVNQLQEDVKIFDQIIKRYGQETASTINDFLSLDPEGQEKASEYIDFLMQKHSKE